MTLSLAEPDLNSAKPPTSGCVGEAFFAEFVALLFTSVGHFGGQRFRNRNFSTLCRSMSSTQSGRGKDADYPPPSPSKLLAAKLLVAKVKKAARRPKVKPDLGDADIMQCPSRKLLLEQCTRSKSRTWSLRSADDT
ncbi:uncharacterized protein EDB93DRAFT_1339268 [Suillus bovinus]|uniref:uncharacterized protein n=1 Tax=Suillus bovinus TaxID=48563 RepID=UPI001B8745ED|nr:uncharacterized protein EDB93DRAFT_1339268 [Suillus bovinus]KAG2137414.1 hypothetical protein EDB93DRAFT_1339268 [Suillus bovinus]